MDKFSKLSASDLYLALIETGDSYYGDMFLKRMFPKEASPENLDRILRELDGYVMISSHRELLQEHAKSLYLNCNLAVNQVLEKSPLKGPYDLKNLSEVYS